MVLRNRPVQKRVVSGSVFFLWILFRSFCLDPDPDFATNCMVKINDDFWLSAATFFCYEWPLTRVGKQLYLKFHDIFATTKIVFFLSTFCKAPRIIFTLSPTLLPNNFSASFFCISSRLVSWKCKLCRERIQHNFAKFWHLSCLDVINGSLC